MRNAMDRLPIPQATDEITADWLNAKLPPELLHGSRVAEVRAEVLGVGEGFASALARLEVTTEAAGLLPPLVAKFASGHGNTRSLLSEVGSYEKEVRFYRELAERVELPTPRCYVAEYDQASGSFILIFEDLAPAAVGDQVAGATLAQAEAVVDALAQFHSSWWNNKELMESGWLPPPAALATRLVDVLDEGMPAMRERWGTRYPDLIALVERARKILPGILHLSMNAPPPKPYTLVHGDVRLDNIFFPSEAGGRFAVIDWQGAVLGQPASELAYWLVTNLPPWLRRQHERDLVRRYHARLRERGIRNYSLRSLRMAYRNGTVLLVYAAPVLGGTSLDFSSERGTALAEAMVERVDAALRDCNAGRVLWTMPWVLRGVFAWDAVKRATARLFRR